MQKQLESNMKFQCRISPLSTHTLDKIPRTQRGSLSAVPGLTHAVSEAAFRKHAYEHTVSPSNCCCLPYLLVLKPLGKEAEANGLLFLLFCFFLLSFVRFVWNKGLLGNE